MLPFLLQCPSSDPFSQLGTAWRCLDLGSFTEAHPQSLAAQALLAEVCAGDLPRMAPGGSWPCLSPELGVVTLKSAWCAAVTV